MVTMTDSKESAKERPAKHSSRRRRFFRKTASPRSRISLSYWVFHGKADGEVEQTIRFATHLFTRYGVHIMMQWYRQIPGSRIWEDSRRDLHIHESMYDDYGFFRNLYLFKTSCRLSPAEIYEIADMTDQLRWLAELSGRQRPSIVHHFPSPIDKKFLGKC